MTARLGIFAQQKQIGASELLIGEGGSHIFRRRRRKLFLMSYCPIVPFVKKKDRHLKLSSVRFLNSNEHGKKNTKSPSDASLPSQKRTLCVLVT